MRVNMVLMTHACKLSTLFMIAESLQNRYCREIPPVSADRSVLSEPLVDIAVLRHEISFLFPLTGFRVPFLVEI